jgi:hypothetical protein
MHALYDKALSAAEVALAGVAAGCEFDTPPPVDRRSWSTSSNWKEKPNEPD